MDQDIFIAPSSLKRRSGHGPAWRCASSQPQRTAGRKAKLSKCWSAAAASWSAVFEQHKNFGFVIPDNDKLNKDIFIPERYMYGAHTNDKVVVSVTVWPERRPKSRGPYRGGTRKRRRTRGLTFCPSSENLTCPWNFPRRLCGTPIC